MCGDLSIVRTNRSAIAASPVSHERDLGAVPQLGDDDLGARIALLKKSSGLDRGLAEVATGAGHPVDLDFELSA
jgi:hypothetical protein